MVIFVVVAVRGASRRITLCETSREALRGARRHARHYAVRHARRGATAGGLLVAGEVAAAAVIAAGAGAAVTAAAAAAVDGAAAGGARGGEGDIAFSVHELDDHLTDVAQMELALDGLCLLVSLGALVTILGGGMVGAEPCGSHLRLDSELLHLRLLARRRVARRLVEVLGQTDDVGARVGGKVVAAAAAVLAGDALDDINGFYDCHNKLSSKPHRCRVCAPFVSR